MYDQVGSEMVTTIMSSILYLGRDNNRSMLQCMLDAAKIKSVVVIIVPKLSTACKVCVRV